MTRNDPTRPFLARRCTFAEAYPLVNDIKVEIKQTGELRSAMDKQRVYTKADLPSTIPCSNPRCQQGGYVIDDIVGFMVQEKETEKESSNRCPGHEGSPKGRRKGDPCYNRVTAKIAISYNEIDAN